ncbi:hypothetical protein K435DRAFT_675514, partial [Dendrothele bispora CBS 962.96]
TQYECSPATNPPLPELKILCPTLPMPWSVIVVTPRNNTVYVTVSDVLSCIYQSLRREVNQQEFYSLFNPDQQRRMSDSYVRRWRRLGGQEAVNEKAKGVKRIDCLVMCGSTRFMGLSSTKDGPHVWQLHVA